MVKQRETVYLPPEDDRVMHMVEGYLVVTTHPEAFLVARHPSCRIEVKAPGLAAESRFPTTGPPRPSSSLLWDRPLWGCVIGRRKIENPAAIQRMVDLCEEGHSRRSAAALVASWLKGDTKKHFERLRKQFRDLEKTGQLPKGTQLDRKEEAIRQYYRQQNAEAEEAKRNLVLVEKEASDLGLDLNLPSLAQLFDSLEKKKQSLESFTKDPGHWIASSLRAQGVMDEEEAIERFRQAHADLQILTKQVELLRRIRMLRSIVALPF